MCTLYLFVFSLIDERWSNVATCIHIQYYKYSRFVFSISEIATFQEISWNQEIWDRKKELQEKWNSVSK